MRITLASMRTAAAMPMASIFTVGSGSSTELVKTAIMMTPAVVMTRFNTAAFVAMTIDRDATVSKMNARRTTVRTSHGMRCEILVVKSM